ncbi:uncharacterized protein LOC127854189 [Dreissena polymorpha]|uniref:uncharacterized protein LOC127854189 n=1 Tax=Dreissena polymorpha TaxID=45954 RepID=UPI0022642EE7|nr:uncharacterized protein LOC127854189 [Dreissena polymorpha]
MADLRLKRHRKMGFSQDFEVARYLLEFEKYTTRRRKVEDKKLSSSSVNPFDPKTQTEGPHWDEDERNWMKKTLGAFQNIWHMCHHSQQQIWQIRNSLDFRSVYY